MNQQYLDEYFSTVWRSNLNQYTYSGWALIDQIQPWEMVLDVGCGFNEFKPHIQNLIGVDPANDAADYKMPIEFYRPEFHFDVAFCLGSINFGSEINIANQITHVVTLMKPRSRIYWRCNPGLKDHGNEECKDIEFYPWTIAKQAEFAEMFGYRLALACWDTNNRIYAEWVR